MESQALAWEPMPAGEDGKALYDAGYGSSSPIPAQARPKDWGVFDSYGRMLAASGLVAIAFNHRFVQEALARNLPLELMTHPTGQHALDILDDDERSRKIIERTLAFLKRRLAE
jgi:hypothetical protein